MTAYLERARVARAVKARVLNGGGDAPAARRDTGTSANDAGIARHDPAPPGPGPRLPAERPEPAA